MNYLLDTNHASPLVTLNHQLRHRVLNAIQSGDVFALTSANLAEVLYGISILPRAVQNEMEWERLRPSFRAYSIDEKDANRSASIRVQLRRQGRQIGAIDALLAAIALRYDFTLLTSDAGFDAVPGLQLANWLKP